MKCRLCGHDSFGAVIDLGSMPLVNNLLLSPDEACPRWPLRVVFCRSCSLAQLTETPPPESMFSEYVYFSSQSHTMVAHAGNLVRRYVKPGLNVVEIASNDGYLLQQARRRGANVLGVDPARNVAAFANAHGAPTRCEFFNSRTARTIAREWGKADVIFANNVLAHVPDPNEFAAGIHTLLSADGRAHVEVPYVVRMIDTCAFDTIYHEHQCYFSFSALKSLFNRHHLRLIDVEVIDIHGGSLHLTIAHDGDESAADRFGEAERKLGIFDDHFYADFSNRVDRMRQRLDETLSRFETIAAVGAAAKGVVVLNAFNLGAERLPWVTDVSPHKQGKFIPGTNQQIVPPTMLLEQHPQAVLLLPWNIRAELIERNRQYLDEGGCFVVAVPEVEVIHSPMVLA